MATGVEASIAHLHTRWRTAAAAAAAVAGVVVSAPRWFHGQALDGVAAAQPA